MSSSLYLRLCLKRYAFSQGRTSPPLIKYVVAQANKMVAEERMRVADLEDQLREGASEREALKLAMNILEEENQRFRSILASASQVVPQVAFATPTQRITPNPSRSHSRHSSKSSLSIPIAPPAPGSPCASPQHLTPTESSPWAGNPGKTPTTADFTKDEETVQPRMVTRSIPPPLEFNNWGDSPSTPYYTSALPKTAEPDECASVTRLST